MTSSSTDQQLTAPHQTAEPPPPSPDPVTFGAALASVVSRFKGDPFSGAAVSSIPLTAPPGRRGMQPSLELTYNSSAANSWVGVGWDLSLPTIQRSTKRGVPKYDGTDTFVLFQGKSPDDLVAIGPNTYRAKIEEEYQQYTFVPDANTWIVTTKHGVTLRFGSADASRQMNASGTFAWALDRMIDLNGNYLEITYTTDQGQLYPAEMHYTGNDLTHEAPRGIVTFTLEDRSDLSESYLSGGRIATTKRLKSISMTMAGQLARRYDFAYTPSVQTGRALLSAITQVGSDGTSTLPPVTLQYQQRVGGWSADQPQWHNPDGDFLNGVQENGRDLVDLNGDGWPDFVIARHDPDGGRPWYKATHLNSAAGFSTTPNWTAIPLGFFIYETWDDGRRLIDLNGDGKPDELAAIIWDISGSGHYKDGYRHLGVNWVQDHRWDLPTGYFVYGTKRDTSTPGNMVEPSDGGRRFGDVNGDGWLDLLVAVQDIPWRSSGGWIGAETQTYLNTGSGWDASTGTPWNAPDGQFSVRGCRGPACLGSADGNRRIADVNGDGLADFFAGAAVYINHGRGWTRQATWDLPDGDFKEGRWLADINGDGLPDLVIAKEGTKQTYLNTGSGWKRDDSWNIPDGDFVNGSEEDQGRRLVDLNGDGVIDLAVAKSGYQKAYLNLASAPDLLTTVDNGVGGKTTFTYQPSTKWDNRGVDDIQDLPFILQTVETVTADDGLGHTTTMTYRYAGGMYNADQREFRGFGHVWVKDAENTETETIFYQDDYFKGKPYNQKIKDAAGKLFQEDRYVWQRREVVPGLVNLVFLAQQDTILWDGNATYKQTEVKSTYDDYGNPLQVTHYGDIVLASDDVKTLTTYNLNPAVGLYDTVSSVMTQDAAGQTTSARWLYYDGASSLATPPTKGQVTKEERWLNTIDQITYYPASPGLSTNPATTMTYDPYGNVATITDANFRTTTTTYDPVDHLYPITITNELQQTQRATYDVRFGVVLTATDANNVTTTTLYDVFVRPLKVIGPNDTEALPTIQYAYDLSLRPTRTTTQVRVQSGQPSVLTTYAFADGLGRSIQSRSPAEDPAKQVVEGAVEYTSRGLVKSQWLPMLQPLSNTYQPTDPSLPKVTFTYDAMGRLVETRQPDNTYSTVIYDDWTTTTIDANGHQLRMTNDGFGRLAKVEEFTGADGRSATYPAAPFTIYATTTYGYDALGNLMQTRDAVGNVATMTYDTLSRKLKMSDPDMGIWTYRYDGVGNLMQQRDAKAQTVTFTYDALNRLKTKVYTGSVSTPSVTYVYDEQGYGASIGRLTRITDGVGSSAFWYDTLGRLIKETKVVDAVTYPIERTYDLLGRLVTLKYPDGELVTYTYNAQGGIETVVGGATYVSNIDYNAFGQPTTLVYGNNVTTTYTYDPLTQRLSHLVAQHPTSGKLQDLTYTFDPMGNILAISDAVATASQTFTYDAINRLLTANGAKYGAKTYSYDTIGNMTNKEGVTQTYTGAKPHAVKSRSDGWTFGYDANGNMATRAKTGVGTTTYTYDTENRLTKAVKGTTTLAAFVYDGDGGRVKKIKGSSVWRFIGQSYEKLPSGATRKYIFSGDQRIGSKDSTGALTFVHGDHLGSSNVLTNAAGARVRLTEYTPFGSLSRTEGTVDLPQKFTGKRLDDETGLYFYEARYYDSLLGRFITADTLVPNPHDPQDLNRYTYAGNNPLRYTDPSGHKKKHHWWNIFKRVYMAIITFGASEIIPLEMKGIVSLSNQVGIDARYPLALYSAVLGAATGGAGWGVGAAFSGGLTSFGISLGMASGEGRKITNKVAKEFFIDVVGMSPRSAYLAASITISTAAAIAVQLVGSVANSMRQSMITQSKLDPRNASGISAGFKGDHFKLAGGRWDAAHPMAESPLGGAQGGPGKIFGIPYPPDSAQNSLLEAYAGPHDYFNSGFGYDASGNIQQGMSALEKGVAGVLNVSNLVVATPFAAAGIVAPEGTTGIAAAGLAVDHSKYHEK